MANMEIEGLEEYERALEQLAEDGEGITGQAIYVAAGIITDGINAKIGTIPLNSGKRLGTPENPIVGVTNVQRQDLVKGLGISPIVKSSFAKDTNFKNVKIGFDGYGRTKTEKYPGGQPIQLIARSVESGTSFRKKHPFVRPTVNRLRQVAIDAMAKKVDEEIERRFK